MPMIDVPHVALSTDMRGKTAFELLSTEALTAEILAHAPSLGLQEAEIGSLTYRFGHCFVADDDGIRRTACSIARRWGQRLVMLALVLKHATKQQRAARTEWNASYWEHWASIQHIWFGGGLVEGPFGREVIKSAQACVNQSRVDDLSLHRAEHPGHLPLLGAARSVPRGASDALVFDFGGTTVKRGLPIYDGEQLAALQLLPPLPVPSALGDLQGEHRAVTARSFILEVFQTSLEAMTSGASHLHIIASVSAYVAQNRVLPGQSGRYSDFSDGLDDPAEWFHQRLKQHTGIKAVVEFVHDGTAAARTVAGIENAAVIMVGTALGSGFPPARETVRPVAAPLHLIQP